MMDRNGFNNIHCGASVDDTVLCYNGFSLECVTVDTSQLDYVIL